MKEEVQATAIVPSPKATAELIPQADSRAD